MNKEDFRANFIVGDTITRPEWRKDLFAKILYIGRNHFFASDKDGVEHKFPIENISWALWKADKIDSMKIVLTDYDNEIVAKLEVNNAEIWLSQNELTIKGGRFNFY